MVPPEISIKSVSDLIGTLVPIHRRGEEVGPEGKSTVSRVNVDEHILDSRVGVTFEGLVCLVLNHKLG